MVIGSYLQYVPANFLWLHKFGRVGYVNLTDDQGNLMLSKEHEGDAKEHEGDAKEHKGDARSIREMPRIVKDARRMADGCSVEHPYYYHNHDM